MAAIYPILKPILKSPQLPELIDQLLAFWEREQQKRADFYNWVSPDVKAEFIEGEIIVHSPAQKKHLEITSNLFTLLNLFVLKKDLGVVFVEKAMIPFPRNDFEPDLCFLIRKKPKNLPMIKPFSLSQTLLLKSFFQARSTETGA